MKKIILAVIVLITACKKQDKLSPLYQTKCGVIVYEKDTTFDGKHSQIIGVKYNDNSIDTTIAIDSYKYSTGQTICFIK
jgi:hypothetical protein